MSPIKDISRFAVFAITLFAVSACYDGRPDEPENNANTVEFRSETTGEGPYLVHVCVDAECGPGLEPISPMDLDFVVDQFGCEDPGASQGELDLWCTDLPDIPTCSTQPDGTMACCRVVDLSDYYPPGPFYGVRCQFSAGPRV